MEYFKCSDGVFRKLPKGGERADHGIDADAVQVPRWPKDYEDWVDGGWKVDVAKRTEELEEARIRAMSPRQRHDEAVARARFEIADELHAAGLIDDKAKGRLQSRRESVTQAKDS